MPQASEAGAKSLRAIVEALNARGVPTARSGRWQAIDSERVRASEGVGAAFRRRAKGRF